MSASFTTTITLFLVLIFKAGAEDHKVPESNSSKETKGKAADPIGVDTKYPLEPVLEGHPFAKGPDESLASSLYKFFLESPTRQTGYFIFLPPDKSPSKNNPVESHFPPPPPLPSPSFPYFPFTPPLPPLTPPSPPLAPSYPSSYPVTSFPSNLPVPSPRPQSNLTFPKPKPPTSTTTSSTTLRPTEDDPKITNSFTLPSEGCHGPSKFLRQGESEPLGEDQCGTRTCRKYGARYHLEEQKCNVIVYNPNYTCVVISDHKKPYPQCCPKFRCDD